MALDLTPDELLSTTRAVRKRLDLTRPVPRDVLEECLQLAQQAPTASYSQNWHFVVVTDAEKRAALGEIWREVAYPYLQRGGGAREGQMLRISEAVVHLAEHIHEVPVHVIPCVEGRYEGKSNALVASMFGSIIPAAWSFMLAARSRGLGSVKRCSPCSMLQRRSCSECSTSTGVSICCAYVDGDRSRYASTSSHRGPPNCRSNTQKRSLEPNMLTRLLTPRSEIAALKRFVCPMIHDVMKPPYEPPSTPSRSGSTKSNFSRAVSTTAVTSS